MSTIRERIFDSEKLKLLVKYVSQFKNKTVFLLVGILVDIILRIFNPRLIQAYIDIILEDEYTTTRLIEWFIGIIPDEYNILTGLAIAYVVLFSAQYLIGVASVYVSQDLAWATTNKLRYDLTEHCLYLDMSFHNKYKPGEMIERVDGDVSSLANFFSSFSLRLISSFFMVVGVLISLYLEHWIFGVTFTCFVLISSIAIYYARNFSVTAFKKVRQKSAEVYGHIEEILKGKEDIKGTGGEKFVMNTYYQKAEELVNFNFKAEKRRLVFILILWNFLALMTTLVFVPSIPLLNRGEITLGTIFLILLYSEMLYWPILQITRQMQNFQEAGGSIKRINELFGYTSKLIDKGEKDFPKHNASISISNVQFQYKKDEPVLKHITLGIENKEKIGLVGSTGCGKTTLSRMIFRLYDPDAGQILINNTDIRDIPLKELRGNIAYITQNVQLFNATVRDNITFFNQEVTDEKILSVIEKLKLQPWLERLKQGLDTELNAGKEGLSAGEAQLLALTRAFLKDPSIVIMDEASSRIDPATERMLESAIDHLLKDRTAIIIAHRLETLDKVDAIALLAEGQIIEYGKREDLERDRNSKYYRLKEKGLEEVMV